MDIPGTQNIVVSWSINPPFIIDSEDHGTARFHERIEAAKKCREQGYRIAFHIDPMIWHPEWKKNYSYLAEELTRNFSAQDLQTITLGTLRFQPEQKQMMRERFGMNSFVSSAEMFPSEGNKLRYDAGLRREMFQHMQNELRRYDPALNVTLCMETPETWINTFDKLPSQMPELKEFFKALPEVR